MPVFELKKYLARGLSALVNLDQLIHARRDCYVISYHRVLPAQQAESDGIHHALWITPETLESQIKWMKSVGAIVEYSRIIDSTIPCDRPLFALTFDDGWKDNYEYALPILKKCQVPALIFLASEAVDNDALFWPQDIATKTKHALTRGRSKQVVAALLEYWPERALICSAERLDIMEMVERWIEVLKLVDGSERQQRIDDYYHRLELSTTPLSGYIMSWSEAREMQKHSISFGSHTHSHAILEGLPPDQIERELMHSKTLIADRLQTEVVSFCYPNGRYSGQEGTILSHCGYCYGFRLDNLSLRHCTDYYYIPRFIVSERKAANADYFKLCLLEAPLYRSKSHKLNGE